jgi:hypothetical protein
LSAAAAAAPGRYQLTNRQIISRAKKKNDSFKKEVFRPALAQCTF